MIMMYQDSGTFQISSLNTFDALGPLYLHTGTSSVGIRSSQDLTTDINHYGPHRHKWHLRTEYLSKIVVTRPLITQHDSVVSTIYDRGSGYKMTQVILQIGSPREAKNYLGIEHSHTGGTDTGRTSAGQLFSAMIKLQCNRTSLSQAKDFPLGRGRSWRAIQREKLAAFDTKHKVQPTDES